MHMACADLAIVFLYQDLILKSLKKSFSYRGAILWNSLSKDQCNASGIAQFINQL